MTREKCKQMLPVIQAFVDGEHIEYWDSMQITGTFSRGMWKTAENIGMGAHVGSYRMIKMGNIHYFDGRPNITDTLNKYKF
jgi:hypothetical protein